MDWHQRSKNSWDKMKAFFGGKEFGSGGPQISRKSLTWRKEDRGEHGGITQIAYLTIRGGRRGNWEKLGNLAVGR